MKKILKFALLFIFDLITVDYFFHQLGFTDLPTLLKVAIVLTVFELLLKPILRLLLLPINILTLGTFRIIIDMLGLYLAMALVTNFAINNFYLGTYYATGFISVLLTSLLLGLTFNIYNAIVTKKKK